MALFRATVKHTRSNNGIRLEKGMTVDFSSKHGSPISTNGGKEVIAAFERVYGVDIKKAGAVSTSCIEIKKLAK